MTHDPRNGRTAKVLVVVSHYNARAPDALVGLLDAMRAIPSGWPFSTLVVVNQVELRPLALPARHRDVDIIYRPNAGYNIGAWDAGRRARPDFDAYLFVQEECRVALPDWVAAFVLAATPPVGLVGECLALDWDAPWEQLAATIGRDILPEHLIDGVPAPRAACYRHFLRRVGIPPGHRGDHLQSLVLFARREVLGAIGGFPVGRNHGEAIAAEIGISKAVQALGMHIRQVAPVPFTYIEHPQWIYRKFTKPDRP